MHASASPSPDAPDAQGPGLPGVEATFHGEAPPEYQQAFAVIAFTMNRFVIDQVLRSSRMFDDDIEAMVIFGTLAHLNVAHLLTPGARPSRQLGPDGRVPNAQVKLRVVRLRDLVQVTGRPRETVRRKLEQLLAAGRVKRSGPGWVYCTDTVDLNMREQALEAAQRLVQAADTIKTALQDVRR